MRSYNGTQEQALSALDRRTSVRVWLEDADGSMRNVSDLLGEDFFDGVTIDENTDRPISSAAFTFKRKAGDLSLVPLDEDSLINRKLDGSYGPILNPNRKVQVDVATVTFATPPTDADWVPLWEGLIDEVDWGGESHIRVSARDPMARLNDMFIETAAVYGDNGGGKSLETTIQEILDAWISAPTMTLAYTATGFAVREYTLSGVSVLAAVHELSDQIGWNLSWRWNSATNAFALTLWQPTRSGATPSWTWTPDDYYMIPRTSLALDGIRNAGEVFYTDTSQVTQSVSDTRANSIALYRRRFIRIDARGTSVVTSTQANTLLDAVLDDLQEPNIQQEIDCAFFWPVELGDTYRFAANDHYSTEQTWSVFGYRHELLPDRCRTKLIVSGEPSGGYSRWHAVEKNIALPMPGTLAHDATERELTGTTTETTMWTATVPANTLSVTGGIRVRYRYTSTGTAGGKWVVLRLNGDAIYSIYHTTPEATLHEFGMTNNNEFAAQFAWAANSSFNLSIDSTADIAVSITMQLTDGADTLTLDYSALEYIDSGITPRLNSSLKPMWDLQ